MRLLLASDKRTFPARSVKVTRPVAVATVAFIRAVVMVTLPPESETQKDGVPHVALTDRDVFIGRDVALVYSTRMMSAVQICSRRSPPFNVNVTPVASAA
jgi:hypothetical protein